MLRRLKYLFTDPPPLLVFEISEQGIAAVRRNARNLEVETTSYRELPPAVVDPAPGRPNILQPEAFEEAVRLVRDDLGPARRPDTALILPDASSRLTVLDFDHLPGDAKERLRLIRFRLKKTVPFDIDLARIAYQVTPSPEGVTALVAVTPSEVVQQYEAPFEAYDLWPGHVSLSTTSALNLMPDAEMGLLAKLAGKSLTMAAVSNGVVRMVRCVDLPPSTDISSPAALEDITRDLYPTCVFVSDNLGSPVSKLVLCDFDHLLPDALRKLPRELDCEVEPLSTPAGVIQGREGGIWGYLSLN